MSHGRYSPTSLTAFDRCTNTYTFNTGPPSTRTRSQTCRRARTTISSPRLDSASPRTGAITAHRPTQTSLNRAAHRLRRSRLKLQKYMSTNRWRLDDPRDVLPEPTAAQIAHLGRLSREGEILSLPQPLPGTWRSEARMRRRRDVRGESGMGDVWTHYHGETELYQAFSILPGEERWWCDEVDWDVEHLATMERIEWQRCEDAMHHGDRVAGVWRDVIWDMFEYEGPTDLLQLVYKGSRSRNGRVMDPWCVSVVQRSRMEWGLKSVI